MVWILARPAVRCCLARRPEDESPVWSPDGLRIAYSAAATGERRDIYIKIVGSNEPERLLYSARRHLHLTSWSPDGKWLAYTLNEGGSSEVNVVSFPSLIRVVTSWLDEVLASEAAPR